MMYQNQINNNMYTESNFEVVKPQSQISTQHYQRQRQSINDHNLHELQQQNKTLQRRLKDTTRSLHELKYSHSELQRRCDRLQQNHSKAIRERDEAFARLELAVKQSKIKQQKGREVNERFQKEKKAWEQKEDATKVALRVSQDRIKLIEEKLKKVMQKGEKIQFKNNLEVFSNMGKNSSFKSKSLQELCMESIEGKRILLQQENRNLSTLLKYTLESYQHLLKVADPQKAEQLKLRVQNIDSPLNFKRIQTTIQKWGQAILSNLSHRVTISKQIDSLNEVQINQVFKNFNLMQDLCFKWQQTNDKRNNIIQNILTLQKQKHNFSAILNFPSQSQQRQYINPEFQQRMRRQSEMSRQVQERLDYFNKNTARITSLMNNLQEFSEEVDSVI